MPNSGLRAKQGDPLPEIVADRFPWFWYPCNACPLDHGGGADGCEFRLMCAPAERGESMADSGMRAKQGDYRNARELYDSGDSVGAARKEAAACDRDGYGLTGRMLRDLSDVAEAAQSVSDCWQTALICDECEENDGWCAHHYNRYRESQSALFHALRRAGEPS